MFSLSAEAQSVPGQWAVVGQLSAGRSGHTITSLADGRLLIAGGENDAGLVAQAEIYDPTTQTVSPAGDLAVPRKDHAAVLLNDGRVLLVGGERSAGVLASAEVFDPTTQSFAQVGYMAEPRRWHTATLLLDGSVLVIGGDAGAGSLVTLERFDPATNTFELLPVALPNARAQHTATLVGDGRVLVVGGQNGSGALALTDYFDPATGMLAVGPTLAAPRYGHTATALMRLVVAIVGGTDGETIYAASELVLPGLDTVTVASTTTPLHVGRWGHVALLLPDNQNLLVVGGQTADGPTSSAELLDPDTYEFRLIPGLSAARVELSGSAGQGTALAVGGTTGLATLAAIEAYSYPTIVPDQPDYPPGTVVTLTGKNWLPDETVQIRIVQSDGDPDTVLTAVADEQGNIYNNEFSTQDDSGVLFNVTATGLTSGRTAYAAFYDHHVINGLSPSSFYQTPTSVGLTIGGIGYRAYLADSHVVIVQGPGGTFNLTPSSLSFTTISVTIPSTIANWPGTWSVRVQQREWYCGYWFNGACMYLYPYTHSSNTLYLTIIVGDTTPPSITPQVTGTLGNNGWYMSGVSVEWNVVDNESAISSSTGCETTVLSTDTAGTTFTCTATSAGGSASVSVTIKRDTTPPTIEFAGQNPPANANGWNKTDVTVGFSCTDGLSGLATGSPPPETILSAEGANQSVPGTCSDLAGNSASATVSGISIDKTPPTVSAAADRGPDANGWYNHTLTMTWSGNDALSRMDTCSANSTYSGPDTPGDSRYGDCWDKAGNEAGASFSFKFDATPPTITLITPPNGTTYLLNQVVSADYACADSLAGMSTCAGTVADGANINTSPAGGKTFRVNATDQAGNTSSATHNYALHYAFSGFANPIGPMPMANVANAGRTVPVKYYLQDAGGAFISNLASFVSLMSGPVACDATAPGVLVEETEAAGSTTIRYDATSNQFIYNWKTDKSWAGSCRMLQLTLNDGTLYLALFQFK
jgi:hypothetical protein